MGKQYNFGVGTLYGIRNDLSPPVSTPFGALQEVSVEFDYTLKELYGANSWPIDVARAEGKITCKAKAAQINAASFNAIFFGQTVDTGQILAAINEPITVPASTPFTRVVTNAVTFTDDLGVIDATTGVPLTIVASSPATGEYAVDVDTGTYTFAAADEGRPLYVNYDYSATTGKTIQLTNQLMGSAPQFMVKLSNMYKGNVLSLTLNACISTKLTLGLKNNDHMIPEFDFSGFVDDADQLGSLSTTQ